LIATFFILFSFSFCTEVMLEKPLPYPLQ